MISEGLHGSLLLSLFELSETRITALRILLQRLHLLNDFLDVKRGTSSSFERAQADVEQVHILQQREEDYKFVCLTWIATMCYNLISGPSPWTTVV